MEPVTILGIVGSVVSIADVVTKSIKKLSDLKSRFRNVPRVLPTLIGQLYIIKAALDRLSTWSDNVLTRDPRYQELARQIDVALDSFGPLLLSLQEHLDEYDVSLMQNPNLTVMGKVSFLWNEKEMTVFLNLIDRQVNALNLLLQAVQCETWVEQREIIAEEDSQIILRLARDCSSSIAGLADNASMFSEDTAALSLVFDFDRIVLGSRAYQAAQRSHLKHVIRSGKAVADEAQQGERDWQSLEARRSTVDTAIILRAGVETEATINESDVLRPGLSHMNYESAERIRTARSTQRKRDAHTGHPNRTAISQRSAKEDEAEQEAEIRMAREAAQYVTAGATKPNNRDSVSTKTQKYLQLRLQNYLRQRSARYARQAESELRRKKNDEITKQLRENRLAAKDGETLLILGSSESGKSSLLKLMKLHTDGEYTTDERKSFSEIVWTNIVLSARVILEAMESFELPLYRQKNDRHVQTIFMQPVPLQEYLPTEVARAVKRLWRDAGFQKCYARRHEYQLCDNAKDYALDIGRIAAPEYLPSDRDILQSRVQTTGITETTFRSEDVTFRVFDVGGLRVERKKWIHCFDDVSIVAFTVDAAAYNKVLSEDETVNRMTETDTLWNSIVHSRWFINTDFILIFTKTDQLEEQLRDVPAQKYYSDFESQNHGEQLLRDYQYYLESRFLHWFKDREDSTTQVRVAWTNLIDVENNFAKEMFEMANLLRENRKHGASSRFHYEKRNHWPRCGNVS